MACSLYNPFRDEVEKYLALKDLNFSRTDVFNLLALPMENRVDIRINLNSETIDWINNLESDSTYSRWPKSVKAVRLTPISLSCFPPSANMCTPVPIPSISRPASLRS